MTDNIIQKLILYHIPFNKKFKKDNIILIPNGVIKVKNMQTIKNNADIELTIKQIQKYWDEIEEILKNNDYLLGNKIYICDILIAVIANWSNYFGSSIIFHENTKKYLSRVISYPSYAKAIEIEKIEYLANN